VAKERRRREKAEEQLTRELAGMNRLQALAGGGVAEQDPATLLAGVAEAAAGLLEAPRAAVFWSGRGDSAVRVARSRSFAPELASRWAAEADSPVTGAFDSPRVLRFSREGGPSSPWLGEPGLDLDELLLVAFTDRVEGARAVLLVAWDRPHEHLPAEEEAVQVLARQSSLLLENASLYRLLTQTRDLWQSAFQSIPTPVVIVDAQSRVAQANPAFLALGDFDLSALLGSPFQDVLEGSSDAEGRAGRLSIPRLNGVFDVLKGPYAGAIPAGGTVWVLRKVEAELTR
jgi:PAS domain-containing protein